MFANGPVDLASIPGRVIPKTLKMVLDTSLLNTQQYKVCIKGKVEKSRERSSALPDILGVLAIEKGDFWSPSTTVTNFTLLYIYIYIHFIYIYIYTLYIYIYIYIYILYIYIYILHGKVCDPCMYGGALVV